MNATRSSSSKRSPSAAAHAANTEATAKSAASRVCAVDINPQFVVVRNFFELDSTVRAVRARQLRPRCNVYDEVGREVAPYPSLGGDRSKLVSDGKNGFVLKAENGAKAAASPLSSHEDPQRQSEKAAGANGDAADASGSGKGSDAVAADGSAQRVTGENMHSNSTLTLSSPLHNSTGSSLSGAPRCLPSGTSPLFPANAAAGTSNGDHHAGGQPRHTATATGRSADAPQNRSRSPRPCASRKILCIWDVDDTLVASGAAGVRQNALFGTNQMFSLFKALSGARHLLLSQGSIDDVFYPGRGRLRYLEKFFAPRGARGDGGGSTGVGGGIGTRDDITSLTSAESTVASESARHTRKKSSGSIFSCGTTKEKTPVKDSVTNFEKGTALIRLTTVRGSQEEPDETNFMYDVNAKARLHGQSSKDQIRWLVLRPNTWGITLATLNSLFTPSVNTACVDGKIFHKMDIAWSLAKSGLWDSVFFVDNNLSEIGIVKYGMNMNDLLELQQTHSTFKFFHAEFMLLAASAKIRQLEKKLGRDVTVPPPGQEKKTSDADETVDNGEAPASPSLRVRAKTDDPFADDSADRAGGGDDTISLTSVVADANGADGKLTPPASVENTCSQQDPTFGQQGRCQQVDLVVAHLHMESETYRQLLLSNRSGTGIGAKNSDIARSTGQSTFMGDFSLSDAHYDSLLAFFRREESTMYQLMDEDMRINGYIDMGLQHRYGPQPRYVHMPVYRRPHAIPHMRHFYKSLCDDVESQVVRTLAKGGGLIRGASVIRGDAHILCTQLIRGGPFLDPFVQGGLALELFLVYTAEGNVGKGVSENVHRAVKKLMEDPREAGKKKKRK